MAIDSENEKSSMKNIADVNLDSKSPRVSKVGSIAEKRSSGVRLSLTTVSSTLYGI